MPRREVVRALTQGEWSVLAPLVQHAQEAEQQAQRARAVVQAVLAFAAGGDAPDVRLDVEKRELYRVPPPAK